MGVGKSYATLHFCHHQKPRQKSSHMTRQYGVPAMKQKARAFLERGDLHQMLRKEILFGLVPKTVSGLF